MNALLKLRIAVDRRNKAMAKVVRLEDALYTARKALEAAERTVALAHGQTPSTLIRYCGPGEPLEIVES